MNEYLQDLIEPIIEEEKAHFIQVRDLRKHPYFRVANDALLFIPIIGAKAFAVYCVLCRFADNASQQAWPSRQSLCDMTGIGWNGLRQQILKLEQVGMVRIEKTRHGGKFGANVYSILEIDRVAFTDARLSFNGSGSTVTVQEKRLKRKKTEDKKTKDNKTPYSPPGDNSYSPGFNSFWEVYPRKVGKDAAWRSWKRLRLGIYESEIINSVLAHIAQDERWKDGYIPNPSTYLNQGRWKDELPTERKREPGRLVL